MTFRRIKNWGRRTAEASRSAPCRPSGAVTTRFTFSFTTGWTIDRKPPIGMNSCRPRRAVRSSNAAIARHYHPITAEMWERHSPPASARRWCWSWTTATATSKPHFPHRPTIHPPGAVCAHCLRGGRPLLVGSPVPRARSHHRAPNRIAGGPLATARPRWARRCLKRRRQLREPTSVVRAGAGRNRNVVRVPGSRFGVRRTRHPRLG